MRFWTIALASTAAAMLVGCQTSDDGTTAGVNSTPIQPAASAPAASVSAGTGASTGSGTTTAGTNAATSGSSTPSGSSNPGSIPTLVNVNLQNVLNNLSVSLQVNRNSIPVTAQVPIDVAAAVCGVSVDALAASLASGRGTCTATTTSAQLTQAVQQQISTGGNVQGGPQTMGTGGS